MRPLHYVVLIVVLAAGLGGSAFLIPRQADLGLMYFKDRQYAAARSIYEKRLAAGASSVDVVMPLAELYTQSGEVSRAVDLLQRFAGNRSDRVDLIKRIGRFQQYEQRPEDYLRTLEEINRRKSSEDSLRELANLFRYSNQNSKLIATLQVLVAKYPDSPSDFLELANLQAIGGHPAEAAATMERLEAKQPQAISADTVELLLSLLLDSGQGNRALERAARWLVLHRDPDGAARLAALLNFKGQPAIALRLLGPFEAMADRNPILLGQWIQLQIANGRADLAFERLDRLRRQKLMPDEMAESFVDLALGRNQLALAIEMAGDRGLRRLPDWLLANLADAALFGKREDFAHRMVAALGDGFLRDRPLLAARLANARQDTAATGRWLERAAADPHVRNEDTIAIAGLYASIGRPLEAFTQVSRLPLESLPDAALLETARLYISLGKLQEGVDRFDRLMAATAKPGAGAGWSLLAASVGRGTQVATWLESAPSHWLAGDTLKDLYFIAQDHQQMGLALATARRIFIVKADDTNRLLLANALVAAGNNSEALPHIRLLLSHAGAGVEETYTAALLGAIRASPPGNAAPLQAELRQFWTAKLRSSGKDQRQRLDLVYGLLDLEAWDAVLPQLKSLAHGRTGLAPLYIETALKAGRKQDALTFLGTELHRQDLPLETREALIYALIQHGGQAEALPYIRQLALASMPVWIAAYQDALKKLGLTGELVAFWRGRAAKAGVQPGEKRSLAFQLLEAGHKDWAESIFEELARTAKPDHADVSELLFLWGQSPDPVSLNWLEDRARRAAGPERAAWLNHLIDSGAAARAAAIASASLPPPGETPGCRDGNALLDVYLRALAELRNVRELGAVVTREVQAVNDPDRIRSLARLARDSAEVLPAEKAYVKLLTLAPADLEARHWLGVYAFSRSKYSSAEHYLGDLLRSSEGAYDDNFFYAEMLWRKGDRAGARLYYARALRAIGRTPSPPLEARVARAQSLFRCGYVELSMREFRSLLAANPPALDPQRNAGLRADFAALLLENGMYAEAEDLLSAGDSGGSRLALLRAHLLSVTSRKSEALELLRNLTELDPNAARPLTDLGLLDQSVGQRRRARSFFDRAASLDPENEDVQEARTSLDYQQAPQIRAQADSRRIQGAQSENRLRIVGDRQITQALRMQFAFDEDWASIHSVRLTGGRIAAFDGVRKRAEASLEREWKSGALLRGSLFSGGAALGAGATLIRPDARGSTEIQLEFKRPYWEFAESLAQDGVRDRAEVSRQTSLGQRMSARFSGAWNRYSLKQAPAAATSVAAAGGLAFRLSARPQVTLEYSVDAEYRLSVKSAADAGGTPFMPLPLASREVHAATVRIARPLTRDLRVEGASGFAADRFGGYAPFINLNVNYEPRGRLGLQLNYDRRLYTLDTARTMSSFGGKLSWRF